MAEQIIVFKNGERVITTLQEVFNEEGEEKRGICLLMVHPYVLNLIEVDTEGESEMNLQVKFSKWCPYSVDHQFRVPYDAVLAIGEPDTGLLGAYKAKVDAMTATKEGEIPQWTEGQSNPNMEAQKALVNEAIGGYTTPPIDESLPVIGETAVSE